MLQPLFGRRAAGTHVEHLTMFTAETFGGSHRFTQETAFKHLIDTHRGLHITEVQRATFVELYLGRTGRRRICLADEPFRRGGARTHRFGSRVAMQNSNAYDGRRAAPAEIRTTLALAGNDTGFLMTTTAQ